MEKSKKSSVLIAVLIVLLVASLGVIYLEHTKYEELNKKYDEVNKKLNNSNNNNSQENSNNETNNSGVKVFGQIDYVVRILGVNGELYAIETNGVKLDDSCDNTLLNGNTSCSNSAFTVKKLNITTSEVADVNLLESVTNKGAAYDAFVIFNDGSVQLITHNSEVRKVFNNYKVKSVSENCASTDVNGNCSSAAYTLTLQDGTTQKVTSLD